MDDSIFLTLCGVPKAQQPPNEVSFTRTPDGEWRSDATAAITDMEAVCIRLYGLFHQAVLGHPEGHPLDYATPIFVPSLGHSSDTPGSAELLQKFLDAFPADRRPDLHARMYVADCQKLIGGIQDLWQQITYALGEFYRALNGLEPGPVDGLIRPGVPVITHQGPQATAVWIFAEIIYIRLHSLLDYSVKLGHEIQGLRESFQTYPKMASRNKQYGARRDLTFADDETHGTLFEDDPLIAEVETVRNQIIHNGLLDTRPTVFIRYAEGHLTEKFILLPDMREGRPISYVNRTLFYSTENKLNLRLPGLVRSLLHRQITTLALLESHLRDRLA
jgi:hypothetical protein